MRDIEAAALVERLPELDSATVTEDAGPDPEHLIAEVLTAEGGRISVLCDGPLSERVAVMRGIVDIYTKREARMDRVNHADLSSIRDQHPHFGALVMFSDLHKNDVRETAENGARLPSGVTRILVPRRVLGFNLRLPLLKSSLPLEEKRTWLTDEIQHKVSEHKVRYYQEPTFIFDD